MKSSADLTAGVIRAEIEIDVPPERVFAALVEPGQLEQWWGSSDTYRTRNWVSDLRPGGQRTVDAIGADGKAAVVRGEYLRVEPPRLLEFTWEPSWENFARTVVLLEIQPTPKGSILNVVHSGFGPGSKSCDGHAQGWARVLGWIDGHLKPTSAGS